MLFCNQDDQEVGSYSYDAYGNVLSIEGDIAKDNPIRYAGYYYDEETKNYYLQARYYNPENGAFLALDPHPGDDEPLSQNGYTYGNNNPVIYVDSDGKYAIPVATVILIPGIGWLTVAAIGAVVGSAWLIGKYGIPWAKKKYSNWYFTSKNIKGWNVRVEEHHGKNHAHWKKGGKKGSVNQDGTHITKVNQLDHQKK
ncbi:RHS repeat-associated core domain-containing protein [Rummeliibacillus sp. NPDC094406]|uniref:RHS repeat-associated core domain-containing protein n=1 Tax=Rummeliibacillus sp. NPDC094406 TaxID=3364511 RepID=UPI0038027801